MARKTATAPRSKNVARQPARKVATKKSKVNPAATRAEAFARALIHSRKHELNLLQADVALTVGRSQAWMVDLESGKRDPQEVAPHLLEKLRQVYGWSKAKLVQLVGFEEDDGPQDLVFRLPIINTQDEYLTIGVAEVMAHRQKTLVAFRDGETSSIAVASTTLRAQIGEMVAIQYPNKELKLRRFTGYNPNGINKGMTMVVLPSYSLEDFEYVPEGATVIGAVVLTLRFIK